MRQEALYRQLDIPIGEKIPISLIKKLGKDMPNIYNRARITLTPRRKK